MLANTTLFTIATEGYLPFVLNLHASLERLGLDKSLVVYCLDDRSHTVLSEARVPSIRYRLAETHKGNSYGTADFSRTMAYKYAVGLDLLKTGKNALYADGDIVFLRDPFGYLQEVLGDADADLVMQVEAPSGVFNAGFWLARAVPSVMGLFAHLQDRLAQADDYVSDQKTMNAWVRERGEPRIRGLDAELFACGNQFLEGVTIDRGGYHIDRSSRPFPRDEAYLLHFNFLINERQKIAAMARHQAIFHPMLAAQVGLLTQAKLAVRRLLKRTPHRS